VSMITTQRLKTEDIKKANVKTKRAKAPVHGRTSVSVKQPYESGLQPTLPMLRTRCGLQQGLTDSSTSQAARPSSTTFCLEYF